MLLLAADVSHNVLIVGFDDGSYRKQNVQNSKYLPWRRALSHSKHNFNTNGAHAVEKN